MAHKGPNLRLLEGGSEGETEHVRKQGRLAFGDGLIEIPEFFTVVQNGEVVGQVSAQFDFSDLPAEWHWSALDCLLQNRVRLEATSGDIVSESPREGGVFRRIRDFLRLS
jgi:hypothetical protein